jgi:histidine triad (HIT) family protein
MSAKTIFERIIDREIKADVVYEDDRALVFRDVNPQAPTHVLIIPKKRIASLADLNEEDAALVGHLLVVARKVAEQLGLAGGFRLVANSGPDAGQTVNHLHFHLLGGRNLGWPPG